MGVVDRTHAGVCMLGLTCRRSHCYNKCVPTSRRHAARYEAEFLADMRALGCREPSVLTRVSDYMGVIVAYVQRILGNGFAYEANGSVYFDTRAFECAPRQPGMPDPCRAERGRHHARRMHVNMCGFMVCLTQQSQVCVICTSNKRSMALICEVSSIPRRQGRGAQVRAAVPVRGGVQGAGGGGRGRL